MAKDLFEETKQRILTYMQEKFPTTEEGKMRKKAKKRVKMKKGAYIHMILYPPVMIFLTVISFLFTPEFWWWIMVPAVGWGMIIVIHYLIVFGIPGVVRFDEEWEANEVDREYRRMRYEQKINQLLDREEELDLDERLDLREMERRLDEQDLV
ncbi:MAG: 2TM domain-containing protein [Saprospiraceae bacterium]